MNTYIIRHRILRYAAPLLCLLAVWLLTSCRDEPDRPDQGVATYQNIATFVGNNDRGLSMLQYREINDSPLVTLTLQGTIDQNQAPTGTRMLVTYTLPEGVAYGTSTAIEASSLNVIYNGTVKTDATTLPDMNTSEGIYVMTLYRSGEYINLMAQLPACSGKRKFSLVADPATLGSDIPTLYLTTSADNEQGFNRKTVASFNMTPVWNLATCRGVKLLVNNTNNSYQCEFTFLKSE